MCVPIARGYKDTRSARAASEHLSLEPKGAFAFQQPPGSALGEFMGNFHELELPEI